MHPNHLPTTSVWYENVALLLCSTSAKFCHYINHGQVTVAAYHTYGASPAIELNSESASLINYY